MQKEIKIALDVADEQPEGTIFIIPARLEDCKAPERLRRWQWVDLFEGAGYKLLVRALHFRANRLKIAQPASKPSLQKPASKSTTPSSTPQKSKQSRSPAKKKPTQQRTKLKQERPTSKKQERPIEIEWIRIPAGEFLMGSADTDKDAQADEKPQHSVYVDAFEIMKYPLTNAQYKAFLDANTSPPAPRDWTDQNYLSGKADHPVVRVSWEDAQACARWLSKETGQTIRPPTEAEWEKAARGTDGWIYPWGNEFDPAKCNVRKGYQRDTTSVDAYPEGASPYGVMDMVGNVWEWCMDWYKRDYSQKGENRNPQGPVKETSRVLRGGSWVGNRCYARCACRFSFHPVCRYGNVGVRFSRTL